MCRTDSLIVKSEKMMEKMKKKVCAVRIAYLSLVGNLCFILEFFLDSWKDNLVILMIIYIFSYQRLILDFWRDNITILSSSYFSLSKTNSPILRINAWRRICNYPRSRPDPIGGSKPDPG